MEILRTAKVPAITPESGDPGTVITIFSICPIEKAVQFAPWIPVY
jgi:hypothetical protein